MKDRYYSVWYDIAAQIGKSVREAKRCISPTEFWDWIVWREQQVDKKFENVEPIYWYLAQIAEYIVKVNAKGTEDIKTKDFLLKFDGNKKFTKKVSGSTADRMAKSKFAWFLGVGYTPPKQDDK